MKRTLLFGAIVVVLVALAVACAPSPTPVPPTSVPPPPTAVPPTAAPTAVPPTKAPTVAPTAAPTTAPTAAPTVAPTVAPTKAPTVAPTTAPTVAPTAGAAALPDLKGRALKVGSDTTYPPFEFVDKSSNIIGYDVDLVNGVCKLLNCKATFITTNFDTIFVALSQKQFDLVASGVTITDDRKKTVDFGDSYLHYGEVILVRADETRIKGKDDLKSGKYIVGVQTGTSNEETAKTLVPDEKKQLKRFDDFSQAVAALMGKDVDCVEIDKPSADGFMAQNPNKLKVAGDPFTSSDLAIAFQKGDTTLAGAFNAALKALKANGTMDQLYKKWFVDYKP